MIADHPTPAYSYFINPNKNLDPNCEGFQGVSARFQFGLKKENLWCDADFLKSSPALADLLAQVEQGQGLMVRFCFYDAVFKIQAIELNASYNNNQFVFNPYVGKVLGTIGVWKPGELASAPVGRMLRVQTPYNYTPPKSTKTVAELAINRSRMASASRYTTAAEEADCRRFRLDRATGNHTGNRQYGHAYRVARLHQYVSRIVTR